MKKPKGLLIICILIILSSLVNIFGGISANETDYYWIGMGLSLIIFSIFTLSLKKLGRIGLIATSILILIVAVYSLFTDFIPKHAPDNNINSLITFAAMFLFGNALYIAIIIYFSNPKIKEIFKNKTT